jgi:hypothetical protein
MWHHRDYAWPPLARHQRLVSVEKPFSECSMIQHMIPDFLPSSVWAMKQDSRLQAATMGRSRL